LLPDESLESFDRVIPTGGKDVLAASVARYLAAIQGRAPG